VSKRCIAIKYCGGCNPAYDRVAAVAEMLARLADVVAVVPLDDERADLLVAVEGCTTACADLSGNNAKKIVVLTSREAVENFVPDNIVGRAEKRVSGFGCRETSEKSRTTEPQGTRSEDRSLGSRKKLGATEP